MFIINELKTSSGSNVMEGHSKNNKKLVKRLKYLFSLKMLIKKHFNLYVIFGTPCFYIINRNFS